MAMFTGCFKVSVNLNQENQGGKLTILISILYPTYSILISSQNLLCFLHDLSMSFLNKFTKANIHKFNIDVDKDGGVIIEWQTDNIYCMHVYQAIQSPCKNYP